VSATSISVGTRRGRRPGLRLPRRPALLIAVGTLLLAWGALLVSHRPSPHLPLPSTQAVARVERNPAMIKLLAGHRVTHTVVTYIDRRYEVVWLFHGSRLLATGVVSASGDLAYASAPIRSSYAYGSNIANDWRILLLLSAVFIMMTGVWPLWRLRNLDVLAAAGTVLAVVLLNHGAITRMVLLAYPLMAYLAARCAWRAFSPPAAAAGSISLYEKLTSGWSPAQRLRTLRLVAGAAVLSVTMIGLSSQGVIDVGYAVMEGATAITHGLLPYGHIQDVLHGDTYPIGSYLLFVPFAAISPVHNEWDNADFTLLVATAAALLAGWGIWRAASRWPVATSRRLTESERTAPLRTLIAWLTFPPLVVTISTGTTDVAMAAILLGALLLWRRPTAGAAVLALGAWFKLAPAALLPLWLAPLRRRRLLGAIAAVAAVSAPILALLVGTSGISGVSKMLHGISYQQTRTSLDSLWAVVGSVPLQQLAQAATLALIAAGAVMLRRDPAMARDRVRIAALGGAVMLCLQMSSSYWTYLYLAWPLPFLVLSLLGESPARSPH
jgi:Glycosyltransferase family 87